MPKKRAIGFAIRTVFLALAVLLAIEMAAAEDNDLRASVKAPARVAIAPSRDLSQNTSARIVITVTGFMPSPSGPVEAVVLIPCGPEQREIGRFGIFPQQPFTAGRNANAQRFGFAVPDACKIPSQVTIRVEPSAGDGSGAELVIGRAEYE
ncbi:hypothetical protein Nham_2942 [Nitrobacter hamburgensis X14]|uniref:Uncharacterized protein n=1 Tax=Nitrobacter hamburgensis (strain DSM 10229 / NCIMB 13809 / X14) TaxID=323097 RepID=Q1QJ89_NITHX|nr:hypothetical protein [Nitrobacter hamburgensis]ABE63708.1 hypothetical protein Nham_2942 [Nitrobacter hamburgensis X14]